MRASEIPEFPDILVHACPRAFFHTYWTSVGHQEFIAVARTIRDTSLETRTARSRLRACGKPYYRSIEAGLHLGYRKPLSGAGKWIARHYIGDQAYTVEVIATADDFSDADGVAILNYRQAQAQARERMVARAHHAAGKRGPLTVRDAMEAYLEFLDAHRKSGYDARHRTNAFILPTLGEIEVQSLTTEQLRKWHTGLAKMPARVRTTPGDKQQHRERDGSADGVRRRQATANRTLTTLKAALNFAWREGRTPSDAAWRRVEPFRGVDVARLRYLTTTECRRLVNAAAPEFRRMVQAALATGCRYGELCRLTVADFSADVGTITVHASKSGRSRHVVLTAESVALFRQWCAGRAGSEILLTKGSGRSWHTSEQAKPMREACRGAKITPPISFHGLRHTWASLSVMSGMPLMVVGKNMGHTDTKMVERHYGHLAPSYVVDAVRKHAPTFGFKTSRKVVPLS
jgi:integrase